MKTIPAENLKHQATEVLVDLHSSEEPVLITDDGQPVAYLVSVDYYEQTQNRMEILEGISRGEAAIRDNKTFTQTEAEDKLNKWLK